MRKDRLFFGLFLIAVGLVLSLQQFGLLPAFSLWDLFFQFWPLLLILMGFSLMFTRSSITGTVIVFLFLILGLGVLLAMIGGPDWLWYTQRRAGKEAVIPLQTRILDIPWEEGLEYLACEVELGAGKLEISSGTDRIAEGELPYLAQEPRVEYNLQEGEGRLSLKRGGGVPRSLAWQLKLTDRVPMSLKIAAGAGSARLDLADLKAEQVRIDMGASDLWLRLGNKVPLADVEIEAGASRLVLVVPADAGVRIGLASPLSQVTLPGYTRQGNVYLSPGFGEAVPTIDIRIDAGVSSLEVREEGGTGEPSLDGQSL
ncbi:MAG: LiaF transmembrane domain-containing protein [bacterium]|jgi:hypothetical protein